MLNITDTSIFDRHDKRKDNYQKELQREAEKQEQQKQQSEPVSEVKSEPTTQATPEPEQAPQQKPKSRADIMQDLGITPKRDTKRTRSLQQAGKVQAYTNALSLLAQAAGGFAGATVPKVDWKNSAGEELSNLQKMYDEEDSWSRRQMLLDKIQELNRKDQQAYQSGENKLNRQHQIDLQIDQQKYQSGEYQKNRDHQFDLNKDRTNQQIRQFQETRSVADDTKNGLPGQRNKLTGEFEFDKQPTITGRGRGTGGGEGTPFFEVYERGSNQPVTTIETKDQAIGLVRDIIDSNKDNPEFEEEILRIIGDKSLSDLSDEGLKFIINKYWKDGQSHIDSPANPYLQYKQQVDDYMLTKFNQEDRKNLNIFLGQNRYASEEDIVDYLQKYDPNIPEGVAQGIAYQEVAKVKETDQVIVHNFIQKRDNLMRDEYRKGLLDKAHKHAVEEFEKGTVGYYKAMRTFLSKQGFSLQEANMIIEDIKDL